jgi:hypothetical protein
MTAPERCSTGLQRLQQIERISLNGKIEVAYGGSGGQIPHSAAGEKYDHSGLSRRIANLGQGIFLRGTQACFEQVSIFGHASS